MNVFELFGKIAIDSSGAEKGIDRTVGHAKGAESKLASTFKKIGGFVAAAFSVRAVVDFGKQCTQAYASIAAEESAFAQIMGDYADTAQEKLNAVADQTGVASTRMTGAMTSLTAKFKGLGYGVEDATTLATDGLLIATDAAAFWDMSLDESMSHLNSFINGSYEGGEAIGLFANDTQMAAYAIEQGIVKDTKAWAALDEATKQATRLDYAKNMQAQSGATGQAAKEADAYANVMANLKEHWRQFQGIIGKPILEKLVLPAMQKLNAFMPKLNEAVQNGIVWLEEGFGKIKGYFEEVFTEDGINLDALPDALDNMFRDLGRSVGGLLRSFGQTLRNGWSNTVWPMIQRTFKAVFGIELPDWATVEKNISDGWNNTVWPAIQGLFKAVFGIELPSWSQLVTDISDGWNNTVWPAIKGFFTAIFTVNSEDEDGKTTGQKIIDWWNNKVKPWFVGAFEVTFEVKPEDSDGTEVGKKIRDWWELANASIGDVFSRTFGVKLEDGHAVGEKIRSWWNTVSEIYGNIFNEDFSVEREDATKTAQSIVEWWNSVTTYIGNIFVGYFRVEPEEESETTAQRHLEWWNSVVEYIGDVFKGFFGVDPEEDSATTANRIREWWDRAMLVFDASILNLRATLGLPSVEEIIETIKTWWQSVCDGLSLKFTAIFGGITGVGSESSTDEGGSVSSDFVGPLLPGYTVDDPDMETETYRRRYGIPTINLDGVGSSNSLLGILTQVVSSMKTDVIAAAKEGVADGMSGVTITANVSTGSVILDGKTVGKTLAPHIDFRLGQAIQA